MTIEELDAALKVVCPILGVSVGNANDKTTWRVNFAAEATEPQKQAAQSVIDAFDPNAVYPTTAQKEAYCQTALNGDSAPLDLPKILKAKMVSDLAFRLGKAPGALTTAELLAERNRIAAIYKAL